MGVRIEKRYTVVCSYAGCRAEHFRQGTASQMEARIAAGVDGWAFRLGARNSRDLELRYDRDLCPAHVQDAGTASPEG